MHNGAIAHFNEIRFEILKSVHKTTFHYIQGTSDSEYAGALFVHYLPKHDPTLPHSPEVMKTAIIKCISHLHYMIKNCVQGDTVPSSLNFAVTDGTVVIATRFRDHETQDAPSLYYSTCKQVNLKANPKDACNSVSSNSIEWEQPTENEQPESVVIASEPLTNDPGKWHLVPKNHVMVVNSDHNIKVEPIKLLQVRDNDANDITFVFDDDEANKSDDDATAMFDIFNPYQNSPMTRDFGLLPASVRSGCSRGGSSGSNDNTNTNTGGWAIPKLNYSENTNDRSSAVLPRVQTQKSNTVINTDNKQQQEEEKKQEQQHKQKEMQNEEHKKKNLLNLDKPLNEMSTIELKRLYEVMRGELDNVHNQLVKSLEVG